MTNATQAPEDPRHMSAQLFRAMGLLQEVNRLVLHPCGVALAVMVDADGTTTLGPILDHRDAPGGMVYSAEEASDPRFERAALMVDTAKAARQRERAKRYGFSIQPASRLVGACEGRLIALALAADEWATAVTVQVGTPEKPEHFLPAGQQRTGRIIMDALVTLGWWEVANPEQGSYRRVADAPERGDLGAAASDGTQSTSAATPGA